MKKITAILVFVTFLILSLSLTACKSADDTTKIGVSFGVGQAARWQQEKTYMEEHGEKLGINIEVRLNQTDEPKTQEEDCMEMIDGGIDVLVLTARDVNNTGKILDYAKEHDVPVIAYARVIPSENIELFVGYDSFRIGQKMGQYLSETVIEGDYILLRGPETDSNAGLLYDGAMRYINPIKDNINIVLDASVPEWSVEEAEKIVTKAVAENGNKVDAILAPNDKIAGACADALSALGVKDHVVITGMDAELEAAKRIVNGTQDSTIYMDLKDLACTAVDEAINIGTGEKVNVNTDFEIQEGKSIPGNLITGQLVVKENLDKILIDSGYFTKEEVYGEQ